MSQKASLFSAIHALTNEIETEKTAAVNGRRKQADNPVPSDPGGYQGASTHPTAHTDNRGQTATEGSRSSENESDVESEQPLSVNTAPDARDGQSNDVNLNIGMSQSATGEDASVEDDYKAGKDDPGSSHPARTDNSALDGHKYANASIADCLDFHSRLADGILADLANGQGNQLTKQALNAAAASMRPAAAGTNPPRQPNQQMAGQAPQGQQKVAASQPASLSAMIEKAAQAVSAGKAAADSPMAANPDLAAGYELAALLGVEKTAAQTTVSGLIEDTIHDATQDATLFGTFYTKFRQKQAGDGPSGEGEDHSGKGDDTSGANGAEGTHGETGGGGGGDIGGGGPPGGDAGGGGGSLGDLLGGGSDPGGMMGGGAGGPPGGAPGGDPMAGASEEQALTQLVSAMVELGITPEQYAQMAGAAGGGGGMPPGGAPPGGDPMGGAMPPPGGDPMGGGAMPPPGGGAMPPPGGGAPPPGGMGEGMKLASAAKAHQMSGKFAFKAANDGTRDRAVRDHMKNYLLELLR